MKELKAFAKRFDIIKIPEYNTFMAEVLPNPNREINYQQKQLFVQTFERLDGFIHLDTPTAQKIAEIIEEREEVISLHHKGYFVMDKANFTLETFESIDDSEGKLVNTKCWVVGARIPPLNLGEVVLKTEQHFVVGYGLEGQWEAEYTETTYSLGTDGQYRRCLDDYYLEASTFYANHPTEEECEARRQAHEEEMAENESEVPLPIRFTQQRFIDLLPKLEKLGPQHVSKLPLE